MSKLQNRGIAVAITTLIVVLSVFLGTVRSVRAEAHRVAEMFYSGVDGSGYGIFGDLDDQMEYAGQLVKVAQKYTGTEMEIAVVSDAIAAMMDAGTPAALYDSAYALTDAVTDLSAVMERVNLSEKDEEYRSSILADFDSYGYKIDKEAVRYNAAVADYENRVRDGLLGSLAGLISPMPNVEAYR